MSELGALTSGLSLQDLAQKITEAKLSERKRKESARLAKNGGREPYVPPGGWRMHPTISLRIPPKIQKPDPVEKASKMTTIDKYREMAKPRTWDAGFNCPENLAKELWRQTGGDTSGHRIFNLSRDDDKTCVRWKPGAYDKDLPNPTLDLLTPSYREVLKSHVCAAPLKVKNEFEKMDGRTTAARELKARVGSDLYKLQTTKEQVLAELASVVESESSSVFEQRGRGGK
jgi:hypothetical protein